MSTYEHTHRIRTHTHTPTHANSHTLSGDTGGKYTVPILWDKQTRTIVNNESAEIIRFFNADFNEFAKNPSLDLYPEALRAEIDEINEW
eukprot:5163417-Pyramimonas_sp.AAC.2